MKEKILKPLNKAEPSQEGTENAELHKLRDQEEAGKRRARQDVTFKQTELVERQRLVGSFLPEDEVEAGGLRGIVKEPGVVEKKKGNVMVLFPKRREAVPCNPQTLRNLSGEKREKEQGEE